MDHDTLQALVNGGAAVSVIAVVVLFLRHQVTLDSRLHAISDKCHSTQLSLQESYRASLTEMMARHGDVHEKVIDRLNKMVEKQTQIEERMERPHPPSVQT